MAKFWLFNPHYLRTNNFTCIVKTCSRHNELLKFSVRVQNLDPGRLGEIQSFVLQNISLQARNLPLHRRRNVPARSCQQSAHPAQRGGCKRQCSSWWGLQRPSSWGLSAEGTQTAAALRRALPRRDTPAVQPHGLPPVSENRLTQVNKTILNYLCKLRFDTNFVSIASFKTAKHNLKPNGFGERTIIFLLFALCFRGYVTFLPTKVEIKTDIKRVSAPLKFVLTVNHII